MCDSGSLGVGYRQYVFDAGRRCLTPSIPVRAHVEGGGCQPGLAHTEAEYFDHFFNMLVHVSRGEECDRERTRYLTLAEVHEHAKLLKDRVTNRYTIYTTAASIGRILITALAALVTSSPLVFMATHAYLRRSVPSLPTCAVVILLASILLLVLAVVRRNVDAALLSQARRLESLELVLADVIESSELQQLRKRVDAHLHKGNLHAAFELNRPSVLSFSRQGLLIVTIALCIAIACAAALHFDVFGAVIDLRRSGGAHAGGGFEMTDEILHAKAISVMVLGLAVSGAVVAWLDIV